MSARELTLADAAAYLALRAEMLRDSPASFLSSPGHDRFEAEGAYEANIADPNHAIFGSFEGDRLVSAAGIMRNTRPKIAHFTEIWGVYTTPSARGKGHSRACLAAAVAWARAGGAHAARLSVSARAHAARRVYESLGFVAWGTEPDSMQLDGELIDEVYMQLRL